MFSVLRFSCLGFIGSNIEGFRVQGFGLYSVYGLGLRVYSKPTVSRTKTSQRSMQHDTHFQYKSH